MKKSQIIGGVVVAGMLFASVASAHVIVRPSQVGIGAFQTFVVGVPNEQDTATISVRLVLPDGLKEVVPNVKAGWTITEKKTGTGDAAVVNEITWTGSIPVGFRDDFSFSAQVPSTPTTLKWKAYQTYKSGDVVSWDMEPGTLPMKGMDEATPYSTTMVINDLTNTPTNANVPATETGSSDQTPMTLSIVAVIISVIAAGLAFRKK